MKINKQNDGELNAIKALASATSTPFKTAFKATLGIAAAQAVLTAAFVASVTIVVAGLYFIFR